MFLQIDFFPNVPACFFIDPSFLDILKYFIPSNSSNTLLNVPSLVILASVVSAWLILIHQVWEGP